MGKKINVGDRAARLELVATRAARVLDGRPQSEDRSRLRPGLRTLGPVSDLERHLPSEWWRTLFNSLYLETDGDIVENDRNTGQEVDLLISSAGVERNDRILDLCCGQGRGDRRPVRRVRGAQQHVAFEAMPHDEFRIGGKHPAGQRHYIGMVFEKMLDGAVEQSRGFSAVGRERQSAFVTGHRR